jgi:hypothetical protein
MCNHDQAINQFHKDYGFDPFRIYCQVTGKPFATILEEEMDSVLSLVCESNDDADAAAQDLWLRVVASMRPSLKWNKFRSNTLAELRVSDPIETLAYLVNRMFGPHNRRQRRYDSEPLRGTHQSLAANQRLGRHG